ncbi:MAG: gamma-glutamyltransferase [Methylobacterium sp.]|nr:gamma-glutamyltransferase [Methylobacterium sp.]MCA3603087.1 gamma-glutamyltransferase [Methylobacterium sp.]MCA3614549.1 gamma-glutamyltransferase [Methylobacterium sp.]MCA4910487.1 gamma-glutamyltransferase [Methylobacterium sp.]
MRTHRILAGLVIGLGSMAVAFAQTAPTAAPPIIAQNARLLPVLAQKGMVASQERLASAIGVDILKRGGNAVDAAVAVGFALAVTLPRAGNLGGGGFMLVHLARTGETVAIDYREIAPAASTPTMFLGANGEPDPQKSRDSGLAVGVPGTVRGMALALEKYGSGKFTLAQLIEPSVKLAREGIPVAEDLADSLPGAMGRMSRFPSSMAIFAKDGKALPRGSMLVQAELANTLEAIRQQGPDAFYKGRIAEQIVAAVRETGGIMTLEDMANYKAVIRPAVTGRYRGYTLASMPPPSSGGVHLVQILNILEGYDLKAMGAGSAASLHALAEAMKPAYADRATFLGDPDRVKVPVKGLTSKAYAEKQRAKIDLAKATKADDIRAGDPLPHESDQTTHYSVVDSEGNAVANTYTLNFSYGLGLVAAGTGVLLNNEMDDFSAKPGAQNAYGLVGSDANSVHPGARPLSSMTPTIVFRDGKLFMVTGSPGGSRIISTTLQVITNVIDFDMNLAEAVAAPRIHHQWKPDALLVEPGLSPDTLKLLAERGQNVRPGAVSGSANSVLLQGEWLQGAADPRQRGTAAIGY